jgi:hypothetical protein
MAYNLMDIKTKKIIKWGLFSIKDSTNEGSCLKLANYLDKEKNGFVNKNVILGQFKNTEEYEGYLKNNALHMKEKKEMDEYLVEE